MKNPKIFFDDLIFRKHRAGGVRNLFENIILRIPTDGRQVISTSMPLYLQPFFPIELRGDERSIFHSTYLGVPSRAFRGKIITTIHDFTHQYFYPPLKRYAKDYLINRAVDVANGIICVSESTKRDLIRLRPGINRQKIKVIYNGVSDNFIPIGGWVKKPQVVFVGWRANYKNFRTTVEALGSVTGVQLVIVGGGPLNGAEIRNLERTLHGRYEHVGYVPESRLNEIFNESMALVYPSEYEGFGIPILEAMRAKCLVITGRNSSLVEVSGGHAIHLPTIDIRSLAEAICSVKNDRSSFHHTVECGYKHSLLFSWEKTFLKTVDFYRAVSNDCFST